MSDTDAMASPHAPPRYAIPPRESLSQRQCEMLDQFLRFSLNGERGPFKVMLHSPEGAEKFQALGKYLRFESALSDRLMELAVLVHARIWSDQYEWHLHAPRAIEAGLSTNVVAELREGRVPADLQPDERVIVDLVCGLEIERRVGDPAFAAARNLLGSAAVTDLAFALGQYTAISMLLTLAEEGRELDELPVCDAPFTRT